MIQVPADATVDDVAQWLAEGVFLVRTSPDTLVPAQWVGLANSGAVRYLTYEGQEIGEAPHVNCFAVWPEMGSFNTGGGFALHMQREARRQYRRTFHSRCVRVSVPWDYYVRQNLGPIAVSHNLGWNRMCWLPWKGTFPASWAEAETLLAQGHVTVALNRRLVVGGLQTSEKRVVYVDGQLAATLIGGQMYPTCGDDTLAYLLQETGGRYVLA